MSARSGSDALAQRVATEMPTPSPPLPITILVATCHLPQPQPPASTQYGGLLLPHGCQSDDDDLDHIANEQRALGIEHITVVCMTVCGCRRSRRHFAVVVAVVVAKPPPVAFVKSFLTQCSCGLNAHFVVISTNEKLRPCKFEGCS
ncbi:unnamed protein product [Ceratitis capitata]|uniref:(Mediterranean fruit fly) hypothetical protein n=1 Tax=Ceratitis capitata TaxID=7213 RepID=A0A811UU68_CERCA|nr:unnamed protein product [Ceratitis capitata]